MENAQILGLKQANYTKSLPTSIWPKPTFSAQVESGSITVLKPSLGCPLCLVFPGYTGDALSHTRFITAALEEGIGVVCVTPRWSSSTKSMCDDTEKLLQVFTKKHPDLSKIHFLRAVSFGAYLSLCWLRELQSSIQRIAFITPCSASQLELASKQMNIIFKNDTSSLQLTIQRQIEVHLLVLENDLMVPKIDPLFTSLSTSTKVETANHNDHFSAGDLQEASANVAKWFGGNI